jgi:signal peptidase I
LEFKSESLLLSSKEIAEFLKTTCEKGLPFKFTAKGMSMSPFICNGDSIIIEPIFKKGSIEEGDIVVFISPEDGRLIVHRVILKKRLYLLKGDNIYQSDGYCKKKHIHGYVKKVIITGKNARGFHKIIRFFFLFLNNYKKSIALLSRYKILTPVCRFANKVLNETPR